MSAILFGITRKNLAWHDVELIWLDDVILNISTNHVDDMMNENSDSDEHRAFLDFYPARGLGRSKKLNNKRNFSVLKIPGVSQRTFKTKGPISKEGTFYTLYSSTFLIASIFLHTDYPPWNLAWE